MPRTGDHHDDDSPSQGLLSSSNPNYETTGLSNNRETKKSSLILPLSVSGHEEREQSDSENTIKSALNCSKVDKYAVYFGIRMSSLLTISALFVLVAAPDGGRYPEGMWVFISVLFVSWFPRLDAASVVEKSIQRLIGTFIGAAIGLFCGFLSLLMEDHAKQAFFLACCITVVTFVITFSIVQFKIGQAKIISKYNYASILCLLTFAICILPFYNGEEPKWRKAVYRIVNVIVGCILGAVGSILILPRSTTSIILEQIERQIMFAGEASEAVLHGAADAFSGRMQTVALATEILESAETRSSRLRHSLSRQSFRAVKKEIVYDGGDIVLEKYEAALKDWRATKAIYPVLSYDPFNFGIAKDDQIAFQTETANILARALRIQNTVVLIDGIVRNDPKHQFNEEHLAMFAESGTLIQQMLTVPRNSKGSEIAAKALFEKLSQTRCLIVEMSARVAESPSELPSIQSTSNLSDLATKEEEGYDDNDGRGAPKFVPGSNVCALLFLQLVEHLILRSLRLYSTWTNVEEMGAASKLS